MAHDVFISYSSRDRSTADAVCSGLESNGLRCWMAPRDIVPGKPWASAIVEAIHDSQLMVVVLSTHSNTSEQVLREVERAVHRVIPIIPFRIEEFELAAALEYYLSTPHWLNADTGPIEGHLQQLASTARLLLGKDATAPLPVGQDREGSRPGTPDPDVERPPSRDQTPPGGRSSRIGARRLGVIVASTVAIVSLVVASLARVLLPSEEGSAQAGPPASDPTPTGPQLVLADDFENPASGWLPRTVDDTRGEFTGGYDAGIYVIRTSKPVSDRSWNALLPGTYADASIAVEGRVVGDTPGRSFGLSCRRQSAGNDYHVALNVDRGTFAIFRNAQGRATTLLPSTPAPNMRRGNGLNQLELSCVSSTIAVAINGTTMATVSDDTYKEGRLGIRGGTFPGNPVNAEIRFDNLVLYRR